MNGDLQKIIENEDDHWSKIFKAELEKNSNKKFSSFWWEEYYDELTNFVNQKMFENHFKTVIEAGSGSGKATILLNENFDRTLLDVSLSALEYAKYLSDKFNVKNIKYVKGNIFSMPFKNNAFDFVWNIGVIEHYGIDDIKAIIREMFRICNKPGFVVVGMPNCCSGPILKAWLLKNLKFISGYKLNTEKFYKTNEIINLFQKIGQESGNKIEYIKIKYFGNPLIMETPKFILKTVGRLASFLLRRNKFLILIICKFE